MIEIKNLPPQLRKTGLEEKLVKSCEENDIVFLAIFGSFVRGEQKGKSDVDIAIEFDENKPEPSGLSPRRKRIEQDTQKKSGPRNLQQHKPVHNRRSKQGNAGHL